LAWFYSGCVYREQRYNEKAMEHYKEAEIYASRATDAALQGLILYNIADLFAVDGFYPKALESYKIAAQFYATYPEQEAHSLGGVGRMFLLDKKADSAFIYFEKGLNIAKRMDNTLLQSLLAQNIGVAYQETKQFNEAEKYFRLSYQYSQESINQTQYYLNLSKVYSQMQQQDSATLYTEKLKSVIDSSENNYIKVSAYKFLSEWEKSKDNNDQAFEYQNKLINSLNRIMNDRKDQSVYEIEQKYNFDQQQNHYNLRFKRFQQWLMILMGVLLVAAISLLILFWRMLKEREAKLRMQENVITLRETTKDLLFADNEARRRETTLKEMLQWKLDVLKKTVQLKYLMSEKDLEKHQPLLDNMDNILFDKNLKTPWVNIHQTVEQLNPGIQNLISNKYPELSETEYHVCLLSYAGMSVQEIAFILNLSEHTVYKARTNLNKKIGSDFCSVLRKAYCN
ncbi:MAG TPA: hypothetical protein GX708_18300, partial [Gallicola sp.]|nr:hypothetical protein [Gallicola sp.]